MDADEMAMLERQALICQALSDPKRLWILHALANGERSVMYVCMNGARPCPLLICFRNWPSISVLGEHPLP